MKQAINYLQNQINVSRDGDNDKEAWIYEDIIFREKDGKYEIVAYVTGGDHRIKEITKDKQYEINGLIFAYGANPETAFSDSGKTGNELWDMGYECFELQGDNLGQKCFVFTSETAFSLLKGKYDNGVYKTKQIPLNNGNGFSDIEDGLLDTEQNANDNTHFIDYS
ncbi:MAG: hypothetical protein ACTSPO_15055, partial [Candidatus Heimdallarchaeaceae archaeon]